MFDPEFDFEPAAPAPLPERPEPRPIRDPQQSLWLPADLEDEVTRAPKLSSKERTKRMLHLLGPTLGAIGGIAVLGYVLYVLWSVYSS